MSSKISAREQILTTAADLFFQRGYQAVGIDFIIAEAGIAKATLYRHFASKDDLIAAYLERVNSQFWDWFETAVQSATGAREQIIAVFAALEKLVSSPTCYGCPFLMAASEFPDPNHAGHRVALAHKHAVRERLRQMVVATGISQVDLVADQLYLLMDGAFMAVRLFGVANPAQRVAQQAEMLLACFSS